MSSNLNTTQPGNQPDDGVKPRPVRKRHIALIVLGAAAVVASAGGIAVARGGGDAPESVPAVHATSQLTCVQLAQMGPAGNNSMSEAALAGWRQLWSDARC